MNSELFEVLGKIAGIGGISLGIVLILFREIIRKKIFPSLTKQQAYKTIRLIITFVFIIALCGIGAWTFLELNKKEPFKGENTIPKEAVMYYQDGQTKLDIRTPASVRDAILSFQNAINKFPNYVESYSGLSDSYLLLWGYQQEPPNLTYPYCKSFSKKGMEIDSLNSRMLTSMAAVELWVNKDINEAERLFKKSLALDKDYVYNYVWYSQCLTFQKKHKEAIELIREGEKTIPTSRIIKAVTAWVLYYAEQYDEAIKQANRVLLEDDNFYQANRYLGKIYLRKKNYDKAKIYFEKAGNNIDVKIGKLRLYNGLKDTLNSLKIKKEILNYSKTNYVSKYELAKLSISTGDSIRAIELIEDTYNENDGFILWLNIEPLFNNLLDNERVKKISNKIFKE